ncbi:AEC family transporter [Sulfitobacter sp. S190]|uniref:AEC family transporter n=1 Tax=Sulfitobacter sp. S190 TaxID=2867022 RepID=UPI0021A5198D|nr:AEC family transporter [Sulfitobacter sp. S190]UWR22315.1 AEC family transporter [Sulfitobacter sp. S190]
MAFAYAVLPLLLMICTGYGLAKAGIIARGQWGAIETLSFRVLIPATLVLAIARSDLSLDRFGLFGGVLVGTLAVLAVGLLVWRIAVPLTALANSTFTSLFQTTLRWNAFVALAAAEQFLTGGLAVIAVAIAVLIPLINIVCIVVLASFGPARAGLKTIVFTVVRNPLVQACVVGLTINQSGIEIPATLATTLDMIGRGALGVGLMAIGAGISLRRLARVRLVVLAGAFLRPFLASAVFVGMGTWVGLGQAQLMAGVLVFAAPAASNGYIVAKQMGGDAELYADVLTWQVCLSLLALPIWASVLL